MGKFEDQLTLTGRSIDSQFQQIMDENLTVHQQLAEALDKLAQYTPPPVNPEPTQTKTTLIGTSLYSPGGLSPSEQFQKLTRDWGAEPEMARYFFPGMPNGWPQFGNAKTMVSFKPPNRDMAGIAAGKYDTFLNAWLDSMPRDKKIRRIALFHEREDDIADGAFSKAVALAADKHMLELVHAANERNGTKLTFGIVLMSWSLENGSGRNIEDYLPQPNAGWRHDWIGFDSYPGNSYSMDLPNLDRTKDMYGRCAVVARDHGDVSLYICETGTSNKGWPVDVYDARQALWINGACDIARDLKIKGWMYWNSITGSGEGNNYTVRAPKAAAAMGTQIKVA